ncbi:uncharacterized protein LOC132707745 [Cylas formicarius]|uniref:uncharacterized protein LOC132707745 n=1 Tax=Cylas formicarius TaxID=197179 RepID=UPI002958A18F|nr:uncharacterized protein LOC132707745 [Cylas formicarius]
MSVIIRLQNLPWSANALDIRQYFQGLSIPEGGVHIVGGEQGDAFIAFSTDEDARQAFNRNNGKIKEVQIQLMLSSRTEMQRVIEQARNQSMAAFMLPTHTQVAPLPAAVPALVPTPAPVPEIKRESRDPDKKRDKKRSRSKSRDRRDRKDRKYRDRSRSRSRERRDRRRRDRSRSRNRSRSRDRDGGRRKDRDGKRNDDATQPRPPVWATPQTQDLPPPLIPQAAAAQATSLLGAYSPITLDQAKRTLESFSAGQLINGFPANAAPVSAAFNNPNRVQRDSWPPANPTSSFGLSGDGFQPGRLLDDQRNLLGGMGGPNGDVRGRNQRGRDADDGRNPRNQRDFRNQRDTGGNRRNQNYDDQFGQGGNQQFDARGRGRKLQNRGGDEEEVNTCVHLEPFYGCYADLRKFFSGLHITFRGIKIINDDFGRKTGICYVQFTNALYKMEALKRDGQKLNNIEVKVEHISDEEFHNAIDRYHPRNEDQQYGDDSKFRSKNITKYFNNSGEQEPEITDYACLKIEDLPTYVKEQDILHMFSQHPLISLHLNSKPRGGSVAYVKFSGKEVAKLAYEEKSQHVIGGKPVTVKPCKDEEFDEVNKEKSAPLEEVKEENAGPLETDCLSVSQLPAKTSDRDISDFFSDIGIVPLKIHLMSNNLGFTGQAFCEFETKEEAATACSKDSTVLGSNTISVKPIKRQEMMAILGKTIPHQESEEGEGNAEKSPKKEPPAPALLLTPSQNQPLLKPMLLNSQMPPRMGGPGSRGPRFGPRGPRLRYSAPRSHDASYEDAPPGCTVYMDNVPYKAGTNEILEFFEGYNSTNNVSRRYNPNNTPSAEAKIIFPSPEDAFRAVKELNGEKIWERPIYLTQV